MRGQEGFIGEGLEFQMTLQAPSSGPSASVSQSPGEHLLTKCVTWRALSHPLLPSVLFSQLTDWQSPDALFFCVGFTHLFQCGLKLSGQLPNRKALGCVSGLEEGDRTVSQGNQHSISHISA